MVGTQREVWVLGASGLVGGLCLDKILCDDAFSHVICFARRNLEKVHPKLREEIADLRDHLSLSRLFQGLKADQECSVALCSFGSTRKKAGSAQELFAIDHDIPLEFARHCFEAGVRHFHLVSALGADPKSLFHYSKTKGLLEENIKKIPFTSITIYRPSLLLGERNEKRFWEEKGQNVFFRIERFFPDVLASAKPIRAEVLADCILSHLRSDLKGLRVLENKSLFKADFH